MFSIDEVKYNTITSDIKLVFRSSTITMMHGPTYISFTTRICLLFIIINNKYLKILWAR